jgi:ketosteroid isomerase-like protein
MHRPRWRRLYTADAAVLPSGRLPVKGSEAIGQFWENLLNKTKANNIKFEIGSVQQGDKYAFQVNHYTLSILIAPVR